jgi:hypothetical protein
MKTFFHGNAEGEEVSILFRMNHLQSQPSSTTIPTPRNKGLLPDAGRRIICDHAIGLLAETCIAIILRESEDSFSQADAYDF